MAGIPVALCLSRPGAGFLRVRGAFGGLLWSAGGYHLGPGRIFALFYRYKGGGSGQSGGGYLSGLLHLSGEDRKSVV